MKKILVKKASGLVIGVYDTNAPVDMNDSNVTVPGEVFLNLNSSNAEVIEAELPAGFVLGYFSYQNGEFVQTTEFPISTPVLSPEEIQGQFMVQQALQIAELQSKINEILVKLGG